MFDHQLAKVDDELSFEIDHAPRVGQTLVAVGPFNYANSLSNRDKNLTARFPLEGEVSFAIKLFATSINIIFDVTSLSLHCTSIT